MRIDANAVDNYVVFGLFQWVFRIALGTHCLQQSPICDAWVSHRERKKKLHNYSSNSMQSRSNGME